MRLLYIVKLKKRVSLYAFTSMHCEHLFAFLRIWSYYWNNITMAKSVFKLFNLESYLRDELDLDFNINRAGEHRTQFLEFDDNFSE